MSDEPQGAARTGPPKGATVDGRPPKAKPVGSAVGSILRQSFVSLDFFKAIFALFGTVIAGAWTVHLYLQDEWKRSNDAVLEMTAVLNDISVFCSKDVGGLKLDKLALALDGGDKRPPATAETRCYLSMYRGRLVAARTAAQVSKPLLVGPGEWSSNWKGIDSVMRLIAEQGVSDDKLKRLNGHWAWILTKLGVGYAS